MIASLSPQSAPRSGARSNSAARAPQGSGGVLMDPRRLPSDRGSVTRVPKLSELELDILRKLAERRCCAVSSFQRVRMELACVIRETAQGIVVYGPRPGSCASEGSRRGRRRGPQGRQSPSGWAWPTIAVSAALDLLKRSLRTPPAPALPRPSKGAAASLCEQCHRHPRAGRSCSAWPADDEPRDGAATTAATRGAASLGEQRHELQGVEPTPVSLEREVPNGTTNI